MIKSTLTSVVNCIIVTKTLLYVSPMNKENTRALSYLAVTFNSPNPQDSSQFDQNNPLLSQTNARTVLTDNTWCIPNYGVKRAYILAYKL